MATAFRRRRENTAAAPAPNSRIIEGSGTCVPEVVLPVEPEVDELVELEVEELVEDELDELVELLPLVEVLEVMLPEVEVVVMPELDDEDEPELDDEELLLELDELEPLDPELEPADSITVP